MRNFLLKLLATITGKSRYRPEIRFSGYITSDIFRVFEVVFGRRAEIRALVTTDISSNQEGKMRVTETYHTFETQLMGVERLVREFFSKWSLKHVKVFVPQLVTPMGQMIPASPFLFAIAYDTTTSVGANSGVGVNATISGSTTFLFVHGIGSVANTLTAVSATAGGTSMTQIGSIQNGGNKEFALGLQSPPTGTISIVITETGDSAHLSRATSYTGTKTTGQPRSNTQGTLTTASAWSPTAITVLANSWLSVGVRGDGALDSAGANTTIRSPQTNNIYTADSNAALSAGSHSLNITPGGSQNYEYTMIEIEVAAAINSSFLNFM